jgi:hypothetical protein
MKPINREAMYDSPRWPINQSKLLEEPIDPKLLAEARARREAQAKADQEKEQRAKSQEQAEQHAARVLAEAKARKEKFDAQLLRRRRKR